MGARKDDYRVIRFVPISDKNGIVTGRIREGDRNSGTAEDPNAAKTASSFVESKRREVVKASNLILNLKNVGKVLPRRNWTCGSENTIFK